MNKLDKILSKVIKLQLSKPFVDVLHSVQNDLKNDKTEEAFLTLSVAVEHLADKMKEVQGHENPVTAVFRYLYFYLFPKSEFKDVDARFTVDKEVLQVLTYLFAIGTALYGRDVLLTIERKNGAEA